MAEHPAQRHLRILSTPRAAAFAGVLFAVLFGTALYLIRSSLPEGGAPGSQWVDGAAGKIKLASALMPFSGIAFLWFIGVVRDGFGKFEDKFFSTVFIGSGLLFLAMIFASSAAGAGLVASREFVTDEASRTEVSAFGQAMLTSLSTTYALRMAGVFMISLGTIWLKTRLMPSWLVVVTYLVALSLMILADINTWVVLTFPVWVLVVSLLVLVRAGVIDLHFDDDDHDDVRSGAAPTPDKS
jgi:hypothetical protein